MGRKTYYAKQMEQAITLKVQKQTDCMPALT